MAAMLSGGDARAFLNLLEFAWPQLPPEKRDPDQLLKQSLPEADDQGRPRRRLPLRAGLGLHQVHPRQQIPDAALYYLACMLESGEDPRFMPAAG